MQTTVLIVDDHAGFRASARRLLEDGGYVVVGEAPDGVAAVASARELQGAPPLTLHLVAANTTTSGLVTLTYQPAWH